MMYATADRLARALTDLLWVLGPDDADGTMALIRRRANEALEAYWEDRLAGDDAPDHNCEETCYGAENPYGQ